MKRGVIRVLIIDDSQIVHTVLARAFAEQPDIEIAGDAFEGRGGVGLALELAPDVIIMDINMPGMSGLEAIEEILAEKPAPIIVFSAASKSIADLGFRAIELGAVDLVEKPAASDLTELKDVIEEKLVRTIRTFADFKVMHRFRRRRPAHSPPTAPGRLDDETGRSEPPGAAPFHGGERISAAALEHTHPPRFGAFHVIAVASSTGGPQMLTRFLGREEVGALNAGIIVLQHMADGFMASFIDWLKLFSALPVTTARPGDFVSPGVVQVAPGGSHLGVDGRGRFKSVDAPPQFGIRPSADVLFESLAEAFGKGLVAVVLSGMGSDGAKALPAVKRNGGYVVAQDEESSLIFGMPKAAIATGCVDRVLNIAAMPEFLAAYCGQVREKNAR
ncbi:MAG: chemotaxis-specific protein-glutamate methyltransferase CheB [Spirochaetales bacterium]|nr:chemotaxis-specific protein-glutamate methyltransferase CheB [Spirochaetales bacterium]